jgi:type III secretion system low calcium response chaperone LcrH/SycD
MTSSNAPKATSTTDTAKSTVNPQVNFLGIQSLSAEKIEEMSQHILEQMGKEESNNAGTIKQILTEMIQQSGSLAERLKMPESQLEGIYNIGYQCYNQTNYKKAIGIFRLLFLLNPLETKYIFSLGLSLEKDKQFYPASTAYLLYGFLEENNPVPPFRTAICFLEMGEHLVAQIMFEKTIELCQAKEGMQALEQRAQLFLAGLKKPANPAAAK